MGDTGTARPATGRLLMLAMGVGLAGGFGCGETTVNTPLRADRVESTASTDLNGPAGGVLPDPVSVQVFGSDNQPLPGAAVTFAASGGGTADPANATTDGDGFAATRWTLGTTAGQNQLSASAGEGATTTVSATVTAAQAATVDVSAGDNQIAPAGSAVPTPPSVQVADAFGNLAADVGVTFSVLSAGGSVTGGAATTNAQGIATVGSWILGSRVGTQTLVAQVGEGGVANNPIVFKATATAPVGAEMTISAGNNQQARVGQLVQVPPTIVVRDASGSGVPGAVVTFAVASGGGGVVGARQIADADGIATVGGWFLGPFPGTNTLTASSDGLDDVTFTATGTAELPVSMTAVSQTTQTAPRGTAVPDPPSVIVRGALGTPVPGVVVTFAVTGGGGTVTGSPATTDNDGVATVGSWTLGPVVGANSLTATATGLPSVTFNATGTAGEPTDVVAVEGDNETAVQGSAVETPPTVWVTDAGGNPVSGVTVTFAVLQGGGTATGLAQTTDADGRASVGSWTLGSAAPNTLRATVTGTGIAGNPVTFTAQSATQIGITSAPAGPVALGADFTVSVQLRDAVGAAVALPGVQLSIAIATGGGTLNGTLTRVTDSSGAVSFTLLNVTGTPGDRTFTVSGADLSSATTAAITFN